MTPLHDSRGPLTAVGASPGGACPPGYPQDGPGLFEVTDPDLSARFVTNVRRLAGGQATPGRALINTAALLLGLLDAGLFAVSLAAQYQYIFHAKHQHWPAVIEAVALDAGMVIFSLLALGLARAGQTARIGRALIVVCALGSAGMNYAAADVTSPRSVLAYTMPPVFLAIVTDRVIAVVRRHVLGMEAERSAWAVTGRVVLAVAAAAGKAVLYGLRLVLAPRSTFSGARTLVLLATPLPAGSAQQEAEASAVRTALGTVRAAIGEDLSQLRDRHETAFRTETEAVRETLRTEIRAVREAARTEAPAAVRAALGDDLRELRDRCEATAATLGGSLHAAQQAFRTETEAVRETLRTEIRAVREALRPEPAPGDGQPPEVDRAVLVAELADQIRDAIASGDRWTPDYGELMARTGYRRRWCEKAVQDARTAVLDPLAGDPEGNLP
jgi:hypothetical protein